MVNPFDHDFFRFLSGFIFILVISYVIIFLVNKYSMVIDGGRGGAVSNVSSTK